MDKNLTIEVTSIVPIRLNFDISVEYDGSSQNLGIVQSRIGGRLTHWDRHLNNGRRSKISSTTPVHLGAVT